VNYDLFKDAYLSAPTVEFRDKKPSGVEEYYQKEFCFSKMVGLEGILRLIKNWVNVRKAHI